jgi:hypothetical protein
MGLYEVSVVTAKIAESALVALVESSVVEIIGEDVILLVVAVMVMVVPAVAFEPVVASVAVEVDKMMKPWMVSWTGASLTTAVDVELNSGSKLIVHLGKGRIIENLLILMTELFAYSATVSSEEKRVIVVGIVMVVISMCLVQCVVAHKEAHSFYFVSLNQVTPSFQLLACFAKTALKKQAAGTENSEFVLCFVSPVETRTGKEN